VTSCFAIRLSSDTVQPVIILTGGISSPLGQHSQSLSFANTVFKYQPHHGPEFKPLIGGFVGAEYSFYSFRKNWVWQYGLAFYQTALSSIKGEEAQAPIMALDAINLWHYHYKILGRQLLIENKLSLIYKEHYRPYLLAGIGESFNHAYGFQVTPQNSGEVATAIFGSKKNQTFSYLFGLGVDADLNQHIRLGTGYRFAYLGKYDLGKGRLDTGVGGSVFDLPLLKSTHSYNHELLIQLTYLL